MIDIKGVVLKLKPEKKDEIGTDDHFYVGVCGKGKAEEFPLDVIGYEDIYEGANVKCRFGDVCEGDLRTDAREPYKVSSSNNPENCHIDMDRVNRVYLRKQTHNRLGKMLKLNGAEVTLYGSNSSQQRKFFKSEDCGPALENGLKVWLKEQ
jgi:hypothetical protein